jgi:hypothetical protein
MGEILKTESSSIQQKQAALPGIYQPYIDTEKRVFCTYERP